MKSLYLFTLIFGLVTIQLQGDCRPVTHTAKRGVVASKAISKKFKLIATVTPKPVGETIVYCVVAGELASSLVAIDLPSGSMIVLASFVPDGTIIEIIPLTHGEVRLIDKTDDYFALWVFRPLRGILKQSVATNRAGLR
ncbi:MAG: hypothetical protein NTY30_04235 [Candidatus Berkelbacteria bacterium]|nr:hypothetical protein [Candidatus Berkelbacteria bacterium]